MDGLAALEAALKKAGRPIVHGEPVDGYARLFARDPFGSRIELMQIEAGWPLRCFGPATASIDLASDRDNVPNDAEADAKKEQ